MPSLFAKICISKKLIAAFLLVGIIPLTVLGLTTLDSASKALEKQSLNQHKKISLYSAKLSIAPCVHYPCVPI